MYVGPAPFQGIVQSYSAVDVAPYGVDAHIDPGTGILGGFQLRHDIAAFDIAVIPDFPVEKIVTVPSGAVCIFKYLFIITGFDAVLPRFMVQNCYKTTGYENSGFIIQLYGRMITP